MKQVSAEPIDHSDWVKKFSCVKFALNNTVHCSTKQTPSKLLFGMEQRDEIIDELSEYLRETYANEQVNLEGMRENTKEAIQKSQMKNRESSENRFNPAKQFEESD